MNISDFCRETGLHTPTIQKYIADLRQTSRANVDVQEQISPAQQKKLAQVYPDHNKVIKIVFDEDDNVTIQFIGDIDGRTYRAMARKFDGSYKRAMRVMQKPEREDGFRTEPTRDEIREENEARAKKHTEALKKAGRLFDDGTIQTDAELQRSQPKGSGLPSPLGQAPTEAKVKAPIKEQLEPDMDLATEVSQKEQSLGEEDLAMEKLRKALEVPTQPSEPVFVETIEKPQKAKVTKKKTAKAKTKGTKVNV